MYSHDALDDWPEWLAVDGQLDGHRASRMGLSGGDAAERELARVPRLQPNIVPGVLRRPAVGRKESRGERDRSSVVVAKEQPVSQALTGRR